MQQQTVKQLLITNKTQLLYNGSPKQYVSGFEYFNKRVSDLIKYSIECNPYADAHLAVIQNNIYITVRSLSPLKKNVKNLYGGRFDECPNVDPTIFNPREYTTHGVNPISSTLLTSLKTFDSLIVQNMKGDQESRCKYSREARQLLIVNCTRCFRTALTHFPSWKKFRSYEGYTYDDDEAIQESGLTLRDEILGLIHNIPVSSALLKLKLSLSETV